MDKTIDFEGNIQEIIESVYRNTDSFCTKLPYLKNYTKLPPLYKK